MSIAVADFRIKSYICDEKLLKGMGMEKWQLVLAVWLAFDAVVFLWVWLDDMYYAHDWKRKLKRMKDALTEE